VFRCREVRAPDGLPRWHFWCPYCRAEHIHGALAGHRTAHCFEESSPLKHRGYYVIREPKR
jgi:hypothetical protein